MMKQEGGMLADALISDKPIPVLDTSWTFRRCRILLETREGYIIKKFQERFKRMQLELLAFPLDCDRKQ